MDGNRILISRLAAVMAALSSALLFSFPAGAAWPYVRNWTKTVYMAGTQNWDMDESSGRFMYFANNEGLLEFDGNEWTLVPVANHTNVRSVMYDEGSGRIYAGAYNEFGYFSLDSSGNMTYTSLIQKFSLEHQASEIWGIGKSSDCIWFYDDSVIYRLDERGLATYEIGSKIHSFAVIADRPVFSAAGKGLMTVSDYGPEVLDGAGDFCDIKICAILPYMGTAGMILVSEFSGVFYYRDGTARRLDIDGLPDDVQIFCADTDGTFLALGTVSDGVFVANLDTMDSNQLNTFSGLQNNTVLSVFFDMDGNLWLGLDKGIDYVNINSLERHIFMDDRLFGSGYASVIHDGRIWLGTNQGLFSMAYDGGRMDYSTLRQVNGIKGQVWCLEVIDGTLFCGHDHGLFVIRGNDASQVEGLSGIWTLFRNPFVKGEILGCSHDGLFTLQRQEGRWLPHHIKGFGQSSSTLEPDSDGRIWFHHWINGLFRLTLNERRDSVVLAEYFGRDKGFPTERNNMPNRYDGDIVFSSEGGYYRYDRTAGRVRPDAELNGLFARPPVAAKIEESPFGDLLFLSGTMQMLATRTSEGFKTDSVSLKFLQNKRIPGFDNITWQDRSHFLINTEDGFSLIDVGKSVRRGREEKNDVVIKKVLVTGGKDSLVYGARGPVGQWLPQDRIRLRYKDNSLRFEFVCPQYATGNDMEYSCFLKNYDKYWSSWTSECSKEYTGLPYGSYEFMVRAGSPSSDVTSGSVFAFTILPPWYLSKFAVIFYTFAALFLLWALLNLINIRSERRAEAVRHKKEEEMKAQKAMYEAKAREKEKEIVMLRNQTLEADLKHKSQDLANSTMNLIRKNEILIRIKNDIAKVCSEISENTDRSKAVKRLQKIQFDIRENIGHDDDWQKFEKNFDNVYEDYLKRLKSAFPRLTSGDMRLCAYLKMDLSSKDMASMMNMSVRSVEMARYRLRQKMGLSRETNLSEFLQNF